MFNSISSKILRYKIKQTRFCRLEVLFSINHTRLIHWNKKKIASQQKRESRTKGTKKPTKKGFKLTQSTMQVLIGEGLTLNTTRARTLITTKFVGRSSQSTWWKARCSVLNLNLKSSCEKLQVQNSPSTRTFSLTEAQKRPHNYLIVNVTKQRFC